MIRTLLILLLFTFSVPLYAQSTVSSISGTVTDSSGAVIPNASVHLHRQESGIENTTQANSAGNYTVQNLQPGHYDVRVEGKGLATTTESGVALDTRQQLRLDVTLTIGATTQEVSVNADTAGTINSQTAQVSAVLTPEAVLDLPANYRGAGSTSPLSVVQALPGVQPDSGNSPPTPSTHPSPSVRYSIQGGLPSQTETTVDGISAQNQTNNNVQADAFPSAESIAEIRVDGVSNNAEYGQPGEITTITRSGANKVHGSAYLYVQNDVLNATPFGVIKPQVNAKDFGASIGGPVVLGHLYNGHDKTFIFGAYEGLRFPQTVPLLNPSGGGVIVPTQMMRMGDFSQEDAGTTLQNPLTGGNFKATNNKVPVNPVSAQFLQFWPLPNINAGLSTAAAALTPCHCNYQANRQNNIDSDQFDLRVDHTINSKASAFVRYSWKDNNQTQYADLTLPNSNEFAQYRVLSSSLNYTVTPHLVNEFQFGFTLEQDGSSNPFDGPGFTQSTGLQVGVAPFFNGLPHIMFNNGLANVYPIGERLGFDERSRVFQYINTLTYTRGSHVLRAGFDLRHLLAHTEAGGDTTSINYGNFSFDQSYSATGDQFADFLLGVPYQNQSNNIHSDNDASANSYAFFAQDTWKITPKLNLSYGMRYEFHPALVSTNGLDGNFSPLGRTGQLIYPAGHASSLDTEELANVNACPTAGINNPYATGMSINGIGCTPVVSNTQAGLPGGLRSAPKTRFEPRFGFAYLPFDSDKTVIRGGASYFNITTSGALYYALEQTLQQNYQIFSNYYSTGANTVGAPAGTFAAPIFVFPNTSASGQFAPALGSVYFYAAVDPQWHDPYSLQQDLSIDHDFGHNFGGRISYIGMHTWHQVWQPQFNQLARSSTRQASAAAATDYPFPNFYQITRRSPGAIADYQSLQLEFTRRLSHGFALNSVYTLAKNLSDNQGTNGNYSSPAGFVDEQGGYNPTDSTNAAVDYGNVAGTRHQRWLTTVIYELPYGHGKHFGANSNRLTNALLGGWQLSNIFLVQSGPWLTAFFPAGDIDPSGTGSGTYVGGANQRPDLIAIPNAGPHQRGGWFNTSAFACPGSTSAASVAGCNVGTGTQANGAPVLPIGRFGTESIGGLRGPGTVNLSAGLSKAVQIHERIRLRAEATFTNVLNHTNLEDPSLDLTSATFNTITTARGSDFGGNRTGQVSVRLEY